MTKQSLLDFVLDHVERIPDKPAALSKVDGRYQPISWRELWDRARRVGRGLVAAGVEHGDRVNIVCNTRLEWVITDLGILAAGGVTVPIYPSNLADECAYVSQNSGARLVLVEDDSQAEKFRRVRDELPDVLKVVQMTGEVGDSSDGWVISIADFYARGDAVDDETLDARSAGLSPESILTLIYTSGTTGRPKGVVLTHGNLIYEAEVVEKMGIIEAEDIQLLFLPLSHSFAKVIEAAWLSTAHVLAFAESMNTIKQNLGEVRPTVMAGVPRVFEKFYAAVVDKALSAGGAKAKLFEQALALSAQAGECELEGKTMGLGARLRFAVLKRLVFAKIHAGVSEILGGRMRTMLSGGAPLPVKIAWFFRDAGIEVLEGYGLTETSAGTTVNLPGRNQIGTVGPPLPGTEVKIAGDGEILLRGPGIMREYWGNPEASAEVLVDGWFHTGDIGEVDPRTKAVRITDRKKDLIITAGGKNIPPQRIENLVKTDPLISQCVVHGDKRKFISAIVTLDEAALTELGKHLGLSGSYAELAAAPEVRERVQALIDAANGELASYETIKKFAILDHDLSIETGELTPKLSVKRKVINAKYGHIFDGFY